jgi:hypothetical protein
MKLRLRTAGRVVTAGAGLAALGYAAYVATAWRRYGQPSPPRPDQVDELLDRFMPVYDIVERHQIRVAAPPAVTLAAAKEMKLLRLPIVRAIFAARTMLLGAAKEDVAGPEGLIAQMLAIGWGVLADVPGREIVVGAVTRPWEPNVTFRALPAEEFARFADPGYVKIVWTLRADPHESEGSIFRTETRAVATDAVARSKFRPYWSFLSPGIIMIRRLSLRPLKRDAEGCAAETAASSAMH